MKDCLNKGGSMGRIKKEGSKPKYQKPVVLDLGELARGSGSACSPGAGVGGGTPTCEVGVTVSIGACKTGAIK